MEKRFNITTDGIEEEVKPLRVEASTKKFDEKNYLDVKLNNGEKKELRIRLLPFDMETTSPFKTIYMHNTKVKPEIQKSGFKNYVCLKHTADVDHSKYGEKCPFCEARVGALNKLREDNEAKVLAKDLQEKLGNNTITEKERATFLEVTKKLLTEEERQLLKDIANSNREKETCIVRCIERGREEDGPKYWKFPIRTDGKDPKGQILNLYRSRKMESLEDQYGAKVNNMGNEEIKALCEKDNFKWFNILDIYEGKDLKITIEPVYENGQISKKTSVTITDYGKTQPVSSDEKQLELWLEDERKWTDVFGVKDYDYLSIIIDGGVPFFDKNQNKWVKKTLNRSEDDVVFTKEEKETTDTVQDDVAEAIELPF